MDQKDVQAGLLELNKTFRFYATLDMVARYVNLPDEVVSMWSYNKFYSKVVYLSHVNEYKKRRLNA